MRSIKLRENHFSFHKKKILGPSLWQSHVLFFLGTAMQNQEPRTKNQEPTGKHNLKDKKKRQNLDIARFLNYSLREKLKSFAKHKDVSLYSHV